jgi:hypothetical protein
VFPVDLHDLFEEFGRKYVEGWFVVIENGERLAGRLAQ